MPVQAIELRLKWRCESCGAAGVLTCQPSESCLEISDRLDEAHALMSECPKLRLVVEWDRPAVLLRSNA